MVEVCFDEIQGHWPPRAGQTGEELQEAGRHYRGETGEHVGLVWVREGPRKTLLLWFPAGPESYALLTQSLDFTQHGL